MPVPRLRRALSAASLLALTVALAGAGSAAAGSAAIVGVVLHDPCVKIFGSRPDSTTTLVQKRNSVKIASAVGVMGQFFPVACVKPVEAGDTLVVTDRLTGQADAKTTVLVPALSVSVNRNTNEVSAQVPTPGSQVNIAMQDDTAGRYTGMISTSVATNGGGIGTYTPPFTVHGSDKIVINWQSGGSFDLILRFPSIAVTAGKATFSGTGRLGTAATARLRTSGGALRASAIVHADRSQGTFTGRFTSGGNAVKVRPGDKVSLSTLTGSASVRTPDLVVVPDGGTHGQGTLTATCAPGSDWALLFNGNWNGLPVQATADGGISLDDIWNQLDTPVPGGTKVQLACETPAGYGQLFTVTIPGG